MAHGKCRSLKRYKDSVYKSGCPVYCGYCATKLSREQATVEHVMPIWRGGSITSRTNMLIVCDPCNQAKARDDEIHWVGHESYRCTLGNGCVCNYKKKRSYGSIKVAWELDEMPLTFP